jgi:hypothetical protein
MTENYTVDIPERWESRTPTSLLEFSKNIVQYHL